MVGVTFYVVESHISAYARCLAGKVCGLVRSTWGTSQSEDKPGARDKILNTKVARRACAGQTFPPQPKCRTARPQQQAGPRGTGNAAPPRFRRPQPRGTPPRNTCECVTPQVPTGKHNPPPLHCPPPPPPAGESRRGIVRSQCAQGFTAPGSPVVCGGLHPRVQRGGACDALTAQRHGP